MVADKEGVRHVGKLLRILRVEVERGGGLVCDDIIHVAGTARARIAEPHDLQRGRGGRREGDEEREREMKEGCI